MIDLLHRSPIAWPFLLNILLALTAIAIARIQVARRTRAAITAVASRTAATAHPLSEPDRCLDKRDTAHPALPHSIVWPEPMAREAWATLGHTRIGRLAAIVPGAADGFDGAALVHRATYAAYLDCRELALDAEGMVLVSAGANEPGA